MSGGGYKKYMKKNAQKKDYSVIPIESHLVKEHAYYRYSHHILLSDDLLDWA